MGLLQWKADSAKALQDIAKEATKPWYKKAEFWIGIIANVIAVGALIVAILALSK